MQDCVTVARDAHFTVGYIYHTSRFARTLVATAYTLARQYKPERLTKEGNRRDYIFSMKRKKLRFLAHPLFHDI
jgi:hypothetical protein